MGPHGAFVRWPTKSCTALSLHVEVRSEAGKQAPSDAVGQVVDDHPPHSNPCQSRPEASYAITLVCLFRAGISESPGLPRHGCRVHPGRKVSSGPGFPQVSAFSETSMVRYCQRQADAKHRFEFVRLRVAAVSGLRQEGKLIQSDVLRRFDLDLYSGPCPQRGNEVLLRMANPEFTRGHRITMIQTTRGRNTKVGRLLQRSVVRSQLRPDPGGGPEAPLHRRHF